VLNLARHVFTFDNHSSSSDIDVALANEAARSWATFECRVDLTSQNSARQRLQPSTRSLSLRQKSTFGGTSWDDTKKIRLVDIYRHRQRTPLEFFPDAENYAW